MERSVVSTKLTEVFFFHLFLIDFPYIIGFVITMTIIPYQALGLVSSSSCSSYMLRSTLCRRYMGHTVRVIITSNDLPNGKAYQDDVLEVKAGYARNYLLPQKMAVYATRHNFKKLGLIDPLDLLNKDDVVVPDIQQQQQQQQTITNNNNKNNNITTDDDEDLKAADLLKYYLRNKVLKIWRNVPDPSSDMTSPGYIDVLMVRDKLSKQLLIDLHIDEDIQFVHIVPLNIMRINNKKSYTDMTEKEIEQIIMISSSSSLSSKPVEEEVTQMVVETTESSSSSDNNDTTNDVIASTIIPITTTITTNNKQQQQQQRIKQLGEYIVRIGLRGGYTVPLKLEVLKR